ncbi:superoxide dismutase family protein [Rubrivirga sp.]|uniref:superoxide dismutase family protein n=1 Tax=Rubrivirga sp. TaxID=1885344 RepID=UPI003B52D555
MRTLLLLTSVVALAACQSTERAADRAAEGVEDAADATATVARGAADAVEDAAGMTYSAAADLFDDDPATTAAAVVRPTTAPNAQAQGTVRFHEMDGGLMVMVSLSGLAPGRHGIHIHENAACGRGDADGDGTMEPGGAAGGHWDPLGTMDHGAATEDLDDKHLGDLGNVTARADGTAEASFTIATFPMDQSVAGHALIVHSGADDRESDPGGMSGTRVGCGVIEGRM